MKGLNALRYLFTPPPHHHHLAMLSLWWRNTNGILELGEGVMLIPRLSPRDLFDRHLVASVPSRVSTPFGSAARATPRSTSNTQSDDPLKLSSSAPSVGKGNRIAWGSQPLVQHEIIHHRRRHLCSGS